MSHIPNPQTSGYSDAGASFEKRALKGFRARSSAPNEDINYNNHILRQRGRMLYMASPVAAAAVNTIRTKSIGPGLRCKPSINYRLLGISEDEAYEWQQKTETEFRLWAESHECDALGNNNFYELEQLAMLSWLMSGDVFVLMKRSERSVLMPYTLRLHLIEADRVSTPYTMLKALLPNPTDGENKDTGNSVYDGIEVDDSGKVVAYHICNAYPEQLTSKDLEWQRVEAVGKRTGLPNVLQIYNAERPDQYRGVTYLAPVIEVLLQQRRYTEAELTAAIVQTYITAWITTDTPNPTDNPLSQVPESEWFHPTRDEERVMGPGNIIQLKTGEKVTTNNPNIPVAGFEAFIKTLNKLTGAALELPYDVLIKEFNSSYSAAKGALEEAAETIKMRRSWFVSDFCQPIYESWLAEAVATGRIIAPGFFTDPLRRKAWCSARWDGPAQTHLDPLKEAKANEMLVKNAWKTNEQVTREYYGGDWAENADIVKRENERFSIIHSETLNEGNDEYDDDSE